MRTPFVRVRVLFIVTEDDSVIPVELSIVRSLTVPGSPSPVTCEVVPL